MRYHPARHVQRRAFPEIARLMMFAGLLSSLAGPAQAYESFTLQVSLYQGLNVTTGMTELDPTVLTLIIGGSGDITEIAAPEIAPLFEFSTIVDVYFGLTTDPLQPFEIIGQNILGLAVLDNLSIDLLTDDLLTTLDFSAQSARFDAADLIVLLTPDNTFVILGNITRLPDLTTVQVTSYVPVPEPGTLGLLGVGVVGGIGLTTLTRKRRASKGGRSMKMEKVVLMVFLCVFMWSSVTGAEELRIITKGTGYGSVRGENFLCPTRCTQEYEKGTIVHLKARPFANSRFAGWLVDGISHEGIIRIEKDTVVTAIFERLTGVNRLTVYWYNGNVKQEATIATDEMAVFLKDPEQWGANTEAEYQAAIQEILHRFHPQAKTDDDQRVTVMLLKSPEALSEEQWFTAYTSLKELEYVRDVGPILYTNIQNRSGWGLPLGEIIVCFPANYTDTQVQTIEQKYGLVERKSQRLAGETLHYYHVGDPLESIRIANDLYESGTAESATPDISFPKLQSAIPDDEYFAKHPPQYQEQWHLHNTTYPGQDIHAPDAWDLQKDGTPIRGSRVTIAVVDDEVEIDHQKNGTLTGHEDLQPNASTGLSYDFIENDSDPIDNGKVPHPKMAPDYTCPDQNACHGTAVAGITGGKGFNTIGICGVAPDATLVGHRLIGAMNLSADADIDALTRNNDKIQIYNNSWGYEKMLQPPSESVLKAIKEGVMSGRGGKGNIYVFAAGNTTIKTAQGNVERLWNSNGDGIANSRYVIAVTSSNQEGKLIEVPGANVLVNAPGTGIITTDRTGEKGYNFSQGFLLHSNYWKIFLQREGVPWPICQAIGTLEGKLCDGTPCRYKNADELLLTIHQSLYEQLQGTYTPEEIETYFQTYKQVFIDQAEFRNSESGLSTNYTSFSGTSAAAPVVSGVVALMLQANPDLSWQDVQHILIKTAEKNDCNENSCDSDWTTNGAGYHINHKYGFGRVDALAAVQAALTWTPTKNSPDAIDLMIDSGRNHGDFENAGGITDTFPIEKDLKIEYVEFTLSTPDHPQWTDLKVTLTSPHRTKSVLIEPHEPSQKGSFNNWKFGSVRHFGESSQGVWTVTVEDKIPGNNATGTRFEGELIVYGTALPPYVQKVTAAVGGQPVYAAEWVEDTVDGQPHIVFHMTTPPEPVDPGAEVALSITTSAAMHEISVEVAGQTYPFTSTDQREWTGAITVPTGDEPQVLGLTMRGQDRNDTYLLPFADVHPQNLAEWADRPPSEAGDTVHEVGVSPRYAWRVTLPADGGCEYDQGSGGVLCTFGDSSCFTLPAGALSSLTTLTVNQSPVPEAVITGLQTLHAQVFCAPEDFHAAVRAIVGDESAPAYQVLLETMLTPIQNHLRFSPRNVVQERQYVEIDAHSQTARAISGTYWRPAHSTQPGALALDVRWEPLPAWFSFREPSSALQQQWCQEVPPPLASIFPGPVGPPAAASDHATLRWTIAAREHPAADRCQLRVTLGEPERAALVFEAQPQTLCDQFQELTDDVTATATYPWREVERIVYAGCQKEELPAQTDGPVSFYGMYKYITKIPLTFSNWIALRTLNPQWHPAPPAPIEKSLNSPRDGTLQSVIYTDCQWLEAPSGNWLLDKKNFIHSSRFALVDGLGWQRQYGGRYLCSRRETTMVEWTCGDACRYQETAGQFTLPFPVLDRQLTLTP